MALTGTDRGQGTNNTGATTFTLSPASNFTAGALAVICIAADNADTGGLGQSTFTVTDTLGNTWTRRASALIDPGNVNAGQEGAIFTSPQDGGTLQTGTVITVTFDASSTAETWTLMEVTSSTLTPIFVTSGVGTSGTGGTSPTITTSSIPSGDMVIAAVFIEAGTTQTITEDGDSTNGAWSTQQTAEIGSTTSGSNIASQRKVVTGTATQTYNPTLGIASDLCLAWIQITDVHSEVDVVAFRGRNDDGNETTATYIAAENTNFFWLDAATVFRIRFELQEVGGVTLAATPSSWQLQYRKNGGTWANVNGSSANVKSTASPNMTDSAQSTQDLLTQGTGTMIGGSFDEGNGLAGTVADLTANNHAEMEYSVALVPADVADGDTIQFRIVQNPASSPQVPINNNVTLTVTVGAGVATARGHGQAQAQIKQTYRGHAQAQARLKQTYNASGQSQAQLKQTYREHGQANAWIENTYRGHGQAQTTIKTVYRGHGQSQASIKTFYVVHGQSQADIKQTYRAHGQSQASIATRAFGHGQAQARIKGIVFVSGQAQAQVKTTYQAYGQAQGSIKNVYYGSGQAQSLIKQTYRGHAQAQAWIEQTYRGYGQAQGWVETTYTVSAQAQAYITGIERAYGQAEAFILAQDVLNAAYGQAMAFIDLEDLILRLSDYQALDIEFSHGGIRLRVSDYALIVSLGEGE